MNTLINDICSFSLSIFGIGITLFTVIYSFISNKREYMNEISHIITSGKACPEAKAKYIIAEKYIQKQKRINAIILSVTIASFVVYTLCLLYLHIASDNIGNHTIFRHANFIGCLSADKIKMPVRKYFCFNIPVYRNMAEEPSCRSPYHEEYIQTSVSGNSEGLCRSTYSFLSERR